MVQEKKGIKPSQAYLMIILSILIIVVGIKMGIKNHIILLFAGVVMCVLATTFGIAYNDLQNGIKSTIGSMLVAMLILIAVGILVGTWIISGTVPSMIYYGMKLLSPKFFLPIVCIVCTIMSTMAGTSWGTLATVGVAFMGVAQGLGVPLPVTAGAICVGAFFGDKVSPLSDSPVLVSSVLDVPLLDGIKVALRSTLPAYVISLIFFVFYGLKFGGGQIGGETYELILSSIQTEFYITPLLFIPPIVVMILIVMNKPTLPTFTAGIFAGAILAFIFQKETVLSISQAMFSGYVSETGIGVVDNMLTRGGLKSMLDTLGLLIAAGVFGAPLHTSGVVNVLLDTVKKVAKNSNTISTGILILHALFFAITGAYYVSYPVVGSMVKDIFPEYGLKKSNLMRIFLDTGTGLAPLVPWATTGAYVASTLGVSNMEIAPYAILLWLSIAISVVMGLTGIGMVKLEESTAK